MIKRYVIWNKDGEPRKILTAKPQVLLLNLEAGESFSDAGPDLRNVEDADRDAPRTTRQKLQNALAVLGLV